MKPYYFKINKTFFKSGITLPIERVADFTFGEDVPVSSGRDVYIKWKGKEYKVILRHVQQRTRTYYALRLDKNRELLTELKKEFIHSYIATVSQELRFKKEDKYHITKLEGGDQEVIIINPIAIDKISMETFVRKATPYDELFTEMIERNAFGWLSNPDKADEFIQQSKEWMDISELKNHKDVDYVVYYLLDEKEKKLYIGSAEKLGERVKPGRKEIPNWNKFRYDIIKEEHHSELRALEYYSIIGFARILNNAGNKRTLGIGDLTLVNKDYHYYSK